MKTQVHAYDPDEAEAPAVDIAEVEYPESYRYPNPIDAQVALLTRYFPGLHNSVGGFSGTLPVEAEGLFAIPRWSRIALSYQFAVERVFMALSTSRRFFNCCDVRDIREASSKSRALRIIAMQQKFADILIVPGQFGYLYRGLSAEDFDDLVGLGASQFGFGLFEVGCMLLAHPGRLTDNYQLGLDCPGDQYGPGGQVPCIRHNAGTLRFSTRFSDAAIDDVGSVTGYLPLSLRR
jgi:hypothetical protein